MEPLFRFVDIDILLFIQALEGLSLYSSLIYACNEPWVASLDVTEQMGRDQRFHPRSTLLVIPIRPGTRDFTKNLHPGKREFTRPHYNSRCNTKPGIIEKENKMKPFISRKGIFNRLVMILLAGAVTFSLAFTLPIQGALADTPASTPQAGGRNSGGLTTAYQREQSALGKQQANLTKASGLVTKIQDLISQANAKGLDTTALQSALSTFQAQLATAQTSDATAAGILSSHNGFDGSGNVSDPTAARQTVQDARTALQACQTAMKTGLSGLQSAVKALRGTLQGQDLQKVYQNEQKMLGTQQTNLGKAGDLVTKIQDLITKANAKGLDTSALASALTTFQSQLSKAQSSNGTAANLLSTHSGFDGNGNVTDPAAASQTVKGTAQALKDCHTTLSQATKDLQAAIKSWRDTNAPTTTPTAPSTSG